MRFALYGEILGEGVTLDALLAEQKAEGMLWAHAENSGCESCYCEVARWNNTAHQWQRYAFCKSCDVSRIDLGVDEDLSDEDLVRWLAGKIQAAMGFVGDPQELANIVHAMPNYAEEKAAVAPG